MAASIARRLCAAVIAATLAGTAGAAPIGPDSEPGVGALAPAAPARDAASAVEVPGPAEEPLPNAKLKRIVAMARQAPTPEHADAAFDMLFDYDYVARWSAGRLDRALSDRQRRNLASAVRRQLLDAMGTYVGSGSGADGADGQNGPSVRVGPSAFGEAPGYASVPVEATLGGGAQAMTLEFRMRLGREGWKAYDVVANSASAVAFYRQYYGDLIRRHGPEVLSP